MVRGTRKLLVPSALLLGLALLPAPAVAGAAIATTDVNSGATPDSMAQTLVGAGISVSNVTFTGDGSAGGTFSGAEGVLGIPGGVVLSSGRVADTAGPNNSASAGSNLGQPGDADLNGLVGGDSTQDAAVLAFDFVPSSGQVFFEYVFGSEEYNSFVGSSFNDVFGFFVNGQNCAVVGSGDPVSVNTINSGANAGLYLNNDFGDGSATGREPGPAPRNTQLDGLTRVLTCAATVTANTTNRMKLAIADNGDGSFDSAVFIRGASLTSNAGSIAGTVTSQTTPQVGAPVHACPVGGTAADCVSTFSNAVGQYLLAPLPPGTWDVTAFPPGGVNLDPATRTGVPLQAGMSQTIDLELAPFHVAPAGTSIQPSIDFGGVPLVPWDQPWTITHADCPGGSASWTIAQAGTTLASGSLSETSSGTYTGSVPSLRPRHGYATLTITVLCPDGTTSTTPVTIYIDPSGTVENTNGDPIQGATVTLYRSDVQAGPFEMVPAGDAIMSPANRQNPVTTGPDGRYQWDTIPGFYRVDATAPGCTNPADPSSTIVSSGVLPVPPPQLDIDLVLFCGESTTTPPPPPPAGDPVAPGSGGTGARYPDPAIPGGVVRVDAGGSSDPATVALQTCDLLTEESPSARADSVIIARQDEFPDTLAGAPLAEANSCVLFVAGGPNGQASAAVLDQVNRVLGGSGTAYVLGGTNAVSAGVVSSLNNAGYDTLRFSGSTRFETANAIAQEVLRRNPNPSQIILANGLNWPDAVAVGAYAAALQLPIVLTDTAELHPAARDIIQRAPGAEVLVIGGRFVIADAVLNEVGGRRIAGSNRMGTAVQIAEQLWPNVPGSSSDFVVVNLEAADNAWQLALQAAPLAARLGAPQLGVRATQYPSETEMFLESQGFSSLPRVVMLGNLGLISGEVASQIDDDIQPG